MVSELPPLQLPDLPAAADAANVVSALGAMLEAHLTAEPADAPGVPEFIVIDGDESAAGACGNGDGAFYLQKARMSFIKAHRMPLSECDRQT